MVKQLDSTVSGILTEKFQQFGLTRQEAVIYLCLARNKELSGYEVSKLTGISRSNVYSTLAGLVEEGAAYLMEGETNKYTAVAVEDFCQNRIRELERLKGELVVQVRQTDPNTEGYITISGHRHIMDKLHNMLERVEYRVYLSIPAQYICFIREQLERLAAEGKKVVILLAEPLEAELTEAKVYITGRREKHLRLIVDSSYVLTGEMTGADTDTCLYCGQKNFVNVFKESLRNEIKLIEMGID